MAQRYWIQVAGSGTGNWNDTGHWSTTSNGTGGASVPTASDDVFFDANSFSANGQSVVVNTAAACNSMDWSGLTKTVTISSSANANSLSINGNLTLNTNLTFGTGTAYVFFTTSATTNILTNGCVIKYAVCVNGTGTVNLTDNTTFSNPETCLAKGTFNLNSNTVVFGTFRAYAGSSGVASSTPRTINFGSATVTAYYIDTYTTGTATVIGGTSNITTTGAVGTNSGLEVGSSTFYDATCKSALFNNTTFRNLTITSPNSGNPQLNGNIAVNGTLTLTGTNSSTSRLLINSFITGVRRNITVNPANVTASNVNFQDIGFSQLTDLSNITGSSGDYGNNNNIIFTPGTNLYYVTTTLNTLTPVSMSFTTNYTGSANSAYSFNGTGSYMVTPKSVNLTSTDKLTICFRAKFTTSATTSQILVENSSNSNNNNSFMVIGYVGTGAIFVRSHDTLSNDFMTTSGGFGDGNWHSYFITIDRSQTQANEIKVYVDGVLQSGTYPTANNTSGSFGTFPMYFGMRGGISTPLNGAMSDIEIWATALSSSYTSSRAGADTSLLAVSYSGTDYVNNSTNKTYIDNSSLNWSTLSSWMTSSGGTTTAGRYPLPQDSVMFDSASFSQNATFNLDLAPRVTNMDWTGLNKNITFSSAVNSLNLYGNLTLYTGLNWNFTGTGYIYFKSGSNLTYNGVTANMNQIYFDAAGSTFTNLDNANLGSSTVNLTNGNWNTNNKTITTTGYIKFLTGTKTLTLGSSSLNCYRFCDPAMTATNGQQSTINAGTSTITCSDTFNAYLSPTAGGGTTTFYNVNCIGGYIGNSNYIFNNLSVISSANNSFQCATGYSITTNGLLTLKGTSVTNRLLISCDINSPTFQTTLTAASNDCAYVDFRSIKASGSANWDLSNITGSSGDCGANTNIIFTAPKSLYYYTPRLTNTTTQNTLTPVSMSFTTNYTGSANSAYSFNGTGSYMVTPNNVDLTGTDKITICFRAKFIPSATSAQILIENSSNSNTNNSFAVIVSQTTGQVAVRSHGAASNTFTTTNTFGDGSWRSYFITIDRSQTQANEVKIYVDGVLQAGGYTEITDTSGVFGNFPTYFGMRGGTTLPLNGAMSDIEIWSTIVPTTYLSSRSGVSKQYLVLSYSGTDYINNAYNQTYSTATNSWTTLSNWYLTTNGVTSSTTLPLPQDDAIFDSNTFLNDSSLSLDRGLLCKNLTMETINRLLTVNYVNSISLFGSFILSNNVTTVDSTGYSTYLRGVGTHDLKTFGKYLWYPYLISLGTYTMQSDFYYVSRFSLLYGTFDLNDFNVLGGSADGANFGTFDCQTSSTAKLYLKSGTWEIRTISGYGSNIFIWQVGTLYCGTSTLKMTAVSGTGYLYFASSPLNTTYYNLIVNCSLSFGGSGNTNWKYIQILPGKKIQYTGTYTCTVDKLDSIGTSVNRNTLTSTNTSQFKISQRSGATDTITVDYTDISYSNALQTDGTFTAGDNCTDGGNNSGWVFGYIPVVTWY